MERNNRTWICSVLFLDIVGYSKLTVSRQMEVKQHFISLIAEALQDIPPNDCINLDTGDGMAICYLADPEDLLFIGIGLRDAFADLRDTCDIVYKVRLGVNLGPVKIVEDINGHRNTIGDGINVAQRIMDFAQDNQLLVSRSFYDVVSCMSDDYRDMFNYLGLHADKHVRKHAVYEVLSKGDSEFDGDSKNIDSIPVLQERADVNITVAGIEDDENTKATIDNKSNAFDESALLSIEKDLAVYVGPLASILVKEASKKAQTLPQLRDMLADEIPNEKDKFNFLGH